MNQQQIQPNGVNYQPQQQPSQQAMAYEKAQSFGKKWTFGFWDCFSPVSTCCLGCWCPCILFGRAQAREKGEVDPSGCGLMCCAYYCLMHIGGQSCLQGFQRANMRDKYGIEGSLAMDFVGACCCPCCGLVQEDKEALLRQTGVDATTGQQYSAPAGMSYS